MKLYLFAWNARISSVGMLMVLMGIPCAADLPGATYYVATNGDDRNPGTESQPFRTIKKGVSILKAGDTFYIKSGTYAESIYHVRNAPASDPIASGTSWNNPIRIVAMPMGTVIMQPASGTAVVTLADPNLQYVVFDGMIFDGIYTTGLTFYVGNGTNHIRIINSELKNGYANNLGMGYGGENISPDFNEFINLSIHGSRLSHGIYLGGGSNNLIENCSVYNSARWGVHIYTGSLSQRANGNIVRKNRIYNNGLRDDGAFGLIISSGDNNLVYNNLIWGNASGIQVDYGGTVTNSKIYNNTIYGNKGFGIYLGGAASNSEVRNNIVYSNGVAIVDNGKKTMLSNNITSDPTFRDVTAGDFSLQRGSSAIDTGATVAMVVDDFGGISRPQGTGYDVGAFEYSPPLPPLSAPTNLRIVSTSPE